VGWHANSLVLGKHSGRNAFRSRIEELGISLESDAELNAAFAAFKALADKKHEIFDEDLHALVSSTKGLGEHEIYSLVRMSVCSETGVVPESSVTLLVDETELEAKSEGSGPVDATFKAIEKMVDSGCNLQLYSVNNITSGTDAQGEVTVRLEKNGRIVNGMGADTDIVIASAKAYLHALNIMHQQLPKKHPQGDV